MNDKIGYKELIQRIKIAFAWEMLNNIEKHLTEDDRKRMSQMTDDEKIEYKKSSDPRE